MGAYLPPWLSRLFAPRPSRQRSLEAAAGGRRWAGAGSLSNVNAEIQAGGVTIGRRAAHAAVNNPIAAAAISALVGNLIGTGIKPQSQHPSQEVRDKLHRRFKNWTDRADAADRSDFYGLQALAVSTMLKSGECFARLVTVDRQGVFALSIELFDADQVPSDLHRDNPDGSRIRAGVEFDTAGRRTAYHFYDRPVGDATATYSYRTIRVPAADVCHLFVPLAPGQVRGLSALAPVLLKIADLDQLSDATLIKAKVAALFAGFLTDMDGAGGPLASTDPSTPDASMEPGSIIPLAPGQDIKFPSPPSAGDFAQLHAAQLRAIAAALGLPYETLSGDLSGATYSSLRAGLQEARRRFEQIQHNVIVYQLCRPIWNRWVRLEALAGEAPVESSIEELEAVRWLPPRWDWIDPSKDVAAELEAIAGGLKSRSQAISERGDDPEALDREIAADRAREASLGLAFNAPQQKEAPKP